MNRLFDEFGFWDFRRGSTFPTFSYGEVVDTSKFDIVNGEKVPRKDYKKKLIEDADQRLKELDDSYTKRKEEILAERKRLMG
jgi:hypothetical protein